MVATRKGDGRRGAIALAAAGVAVGAAAAALHRRRRAKQVPAADAGLVVRRLLEEPWQGNWEVIEELVSPSYLGHDTAEPEPTRGPAGVRAKVEQYLAAFPGAAITVEEQIAEGDRVATRWTSRGTQTGEISGIAPTGKEVTFSGLTISRLENGLVVEEWTTWDRLGLLVQLGAIPEPARA